VLEVLEHSRQRHMSAETIYRALLDSGEELGLATV
jgi:Fur family ferric uptake transcriptional regulator